MDLAHDTLTFTRAFNASPVRLFAVFADPREREVWSAPSPTAEVRIETSDFRTGGRETARCGGKGDLRWRLSTLYHQVIPDRLVSFTEELWEGDTLLTVALITFDFAPEGTGTKLTLTDQVTSFVGPDAIHGHRQGYTAAPANLAALVGDSSLES